MMKKFTCLFFLLTFLLVTGCVKQPPLGATPQSTTLSTEATTQLEQQLPPLAQQHPIVALSMPIYTQRIANGDLNLFEYIYQDLILIMPEEEAADRIIIDFLNRTDISAQAEQLAQWAQADYFDGYPDWVPYQCRATYEPTRFDEAILSMFGTQVVFGGFNLSQHFVQAVNYDMTTGNVLSLSTVLTNISRDELCSLILSQLESRKEELSLYDDYENTVLERFSGSIAAEKNWYFSKTGLCFFFAPYEIAPNATGVITIDISYSDLAGKMDDAFFPPELEPGLGTMEVLEFTDENAEKFNQFAELFLDQADGNILIYTNASVTDVRLERMDETFDVTSFVPFYTLFSAPHMTPGDALNFQFKTADLHRYRLCFSRADENYYKYFTLDSSTNTVLLID